MPIVGNIAIALLDSQSMMTVILVFTSINRSLGVFDFFQVPVDSELYVCHIQAPTGETRGIESVHPASHNESLLWHNGIIKEYDCARLRTKQKSTEMWDTKLLLKEAIDPFNFSANLSEVNGSFACILYEPINGMFVFRNALSPLFIGKRCISSVKCDLADSSIPRRDLLPINSNF